MRRCLAWTLTLGVALIGATLPLGARAAVCGPDFDRAIPARPALAPAGRAFAQGLEGLDADQREAAILDQVLSGNVPEFMRRLVPVTLGGNPPEGSARDVVVCVMPDYLAVGNDADFVLVPMRLQTALQIARRFGFVLPTRKMVDAIYHQAQVHLPPQPLPAGPAMTSVAYFLHHNELLREQRLAQAAAPGALTAGDKKDLVVSNRLWQNADKVAIYGWHRVDGRAIQPLSTVHGARYADYSHGVRLVAANAYDNGVLRPLASLLQNAASAALLSDEGVIPRFSELVDRLSAAVPLRSTLAAPNVLSAYLR